LRINNVTVWATGPENDIKNRTIMRHNFISGKRYHNKPLI
jgi:hypothetical protein